MVDNLITNNGYSYNVRVDFGVIKDPCQFSCILTTAYMHGRFCHSTDRVSPLFAVKTSRFYDGRFNGLKRFNEPSEVEGRAAATAASAM